MWNRLGACQIDMTATIARLDMPAAMTCLQVDPSLQFDPACVSTKFAPVSRAAVTYAWATLGRVPPSHQTAEEK